MINQPNSINVHHSYSMQLYEQPEPSTAQYSYALHLKYDKELPMEEDQIKSVINTARNALHKTFNSKKKLRQKKKQKQFYFGNIEEHRNMADQYEQFQHNMLNKTIKTRIRVFSNSKTQSHKATPNSKYKPVPIKVINLKQQLNTTNTKKPASNRKITRVPKAQPRKVQATPIKNQRKIATIRLFETSRQKPTKQKQNTAQKKRTHKLSVTSVRRRKQQDSFQTYRREMSSQILGLKPSHSTEHHQSSILVNSFNMTTTMFP